MESKTLTDLQGAVLIKRPGDESPDPTKDLNTDLVHEIAPICYGVEMDYARWLGDSTFVPWGDMSDRNRESYRIGVAHILMNHHATPKDLHELWCKTKREEGWTFGPAKDLDKQETPWLIDWEDLPQLITLKGVLFHSIVCRLAGIETASIDIGMEEKEPE